MPRSAGRCSQTVRRDGVTTRFDRQTGAFIAFNPNGTIRTFFKPNDGERYYRRQAESAPANEAAARRPARPMSTSCAT